MNVEDPREKTKALLRNGDLTALVKQAAQLHGHYCRGLAFLVLAGWAGLKLSCHELQGEKVEAVLCGNFGVAGTW